MKKIFSAALMFGLILALAIPGFAKTKTIRIGFNIPLTGEIPKVGESSKYAAEMLKACGPEAGRTRLFAGYWRYRRFRNR